MSDEGPRRLVPVLGPKDSLVAALRGTRVLASSHIVGVPNWKLLTALAGDADTCVLASPREEDGGQLQLFRLSAECPHCTLVLVSTPRSGMKDDPEARYPPNTEHFKGLITGPDLPRRVAAARLRGWSRRLCDRILKADHLPYVTRLAMAQALKQDGPERRSLTELAERVGVSRSHLSRTSSNSGVQVMDLVDAWCVVQSVALRSYEGLTWSRVAWRCGYESLSGLSDLFHRSTGVRLRGAAISAPDEWFRWFERDMLRPLLEPDEAA